MMEKSGIMDVTEAMSVQLMPSARKIDRALKKSFSECSKHKASLEHKRKEIKKRRKREKAKRRKR